MTESDASPPHPEGGAGDGSGFGPALSWPALSWVEARVLGCLIEKSITTPDHYPLSLNALRLACNQVTNRDPVASLDDHVVEEALASLRERALARRLKNPGERVVKHRHVAADALALDAAQIAILCVLLLRGAQTPGELKQRTDRMHDFESLDAIESTLARLADRGLVMRADRRPGQKEARWRERLSETSANDESARPSAGAPHEPPGDSGTAAGEPAEPELVRLDIVDAHTSKLIRSLATDTDHEVEAKVARARAALPSWCALDRAARADTLLRSLERIDHNRDELADLAASETGGDASSIVRVLGSATDEALARMDDDGVSPPGVIAVITSSADPHERLVVLVARAVLGGSTVVAKPSRHATLSALAIIERFHDCGVPADVLQCVVGGVTAGSALASAGVDRLHFSGVHEVGARVARLAGARGTPVDLVLRVPPTPG